MSFRRILVLLVLVAALGTYLYVWEVPQARKEATKQKLLAVDKEAVTAVSLVYPDREIELRKDERGWRLVKPVDAPADETAVKGVVATLADAELQKTLDELPADLAPFGLDKPTVTARLTLKGGEQTPAIAVGKNTAIGGKTYVRKGDEPKLYLTTSSIGFGLNKQAKDLRDKQLLVFQDDDVAKVEIIPTGAEVTTLTRKDKDSWTVDPGNHPADPTEARSYLSSLRATRANDFPDDAADLGKYGLDHPRLAIRILPAKEGAEPLELLLGGEATEGTQKVVYAKRTGQPTVYSLGDWSFRTLSKTAAQLRDKTVLGFDPGRVGRLAIERKDGGGTTMARTDAGWTVDGAEGKKSKGDVVSRYLDDLRELRGAEIVAEPAGELGRWGLDAPDLRITLTDKDGQAMGTVLASKRDAKYYTMRAGGETVFEARDYMYTRLDKQPADFTESATAPAGAKSPSATAPVPPPEAGDDGDTEPPDDTDEE